MSLSSQKIMKLMIRLVMIVAFSGTICPLQAGELGHYMPGVASVRDFIVPEPGFYYVQYNVFYTTDTYKDRNGNTVDSIGPIDVDITVDSFAIVPTFIWASPWKILGATYAVFAQTPFSNVSMQAALSTTTNHGVNIDESQWGLGDFYIRPVWLGWNSKHFALSAAYGFYAPTGEYDNGAVDNTGLGFWTHAFTAGGTWFPWESQGTAVMINGTYEINQDKDDADITPGDRFSLDWGISQFLPINKAQTLLLELGIAGYSQWQVDNDSGNDVNEVLNVKDEVHGIGGQLGLVHAPWNASLAFRYMQEYDAEARFEAELFTLTIAKGF